MDQLDLNMPQESVIIGKVTKPIMKLLELEYEEKDIILWKDRLRYIDKHKTDFPSEDNFEMHIRSIPSIVQNPDYVRLHPSRDSVQFIKRIDEIMLVGVRISTSKKWVFRSAYPISQAKFDTYLSSGSLKKFDN